MRIHFNMHVFGAWISNYTHRVLWCTYLSMPWIRDCCTKSSHSCVTVRFNSLIAMPVFYIKCCAVITRSVFSKSSQKTPHSLPVRVRYGVPVVILKSDSLSATIIAVPYAISWQIGRHNGTSLYVRLTFPWISLAGIWRYIHQAFCFILRTNQWNISMVKQIEITVFASAFAFGLWMR